MTDQTQHSSAGMISWQELDALLELASMAPMNSPTRLWLQGISLRLAQAQQTALAQANAMAAGVAIPNAPADAENH